VSMRTDEIIHERVGGDLLGKEVRFILPSTRKKKGYIRAVAKKEALITGRDDVDRWIAWEYVFYV